MSSMSSATAFMLRQDGEAFPCTQHFYGSTACVEETLYAAEWLYKHTMHQKTRDAVLALISSYGRSINPKRNSIRNILLEIKQKSYKFLTYDFVYEHAEEMPAVNADDLESWNKKVCLLLNEEFTRVRLGGLYHTVEGCRDLYFRISSEGFDWRSAIQQFLDIYKEKFDTITVVRDEESTGKDYFYKFENAQEINCVSTECFDISKASPLI